VAAGPSFRRGVASDLPSGNVDLAPTVLALLGLAPQGLLDGRVLAEAFRTGAPPSPAPRAAVEHVVERRTPSGALVQRLVLEQVGATTYVSSLEACRT
jgi:arylsulfatase A-like enzyme